MQERSIFLDREDASQIEEDERNLFIKGILEEVGVPLEEIWPDISITTDQKIKLRGLLSKLGIEIVQESDRGYTVYHENVKLAEWFKPRFILREDRTAKSLSKKLYYEMIVKTWSMYEKEKND